MEIAVEEVLAQLNIGLNHVENDLRAKVAR